MKRIAFIHSPSSLKNKKDGGCLRTLAETLFPEEYYAVSKSDVSLNRILQNFKNLNVSHIIVDGGDGTISRVITSMNEVYPRNNFPKITVLPSGNTNLIAYDIGAKRRDIAFLRSIIEKTTTLSIVRRSSIRISFPKTEISPKYGMFGGCGSYERAVKHSRGNIENIAPHMLAILATILNFSLKILFSQKERHILYKGVEMPWYGKEFSSFSKDIFFTLMTSLHHLPYRLWPFWNVSPQKDGKFIFLRISSFPKDFIFAIFYLLSGKIPSWMRKSPDYQSGSLSHLLAELHVPFVLDGEFYAPSPNGLLNIEVGPEIEFLV